MKAKKTVLYVVEDVKSAQFRYRVKNVVEALKESEAYEGKWVLTSELATTDLSNVGLVVILRQTGKDKAIFDFMKKAKSSGIKVLFDLDDLIFDFKDLPILMSSTNSKNILYWTGYVWGIRRIAKKADGFIATNDFLARKLKRSFGKPCKVIPNSLNSEQIEIADDNLKNKKHDKFVIGYFSGSPTHTKDLKLIEPEIFRFLDRHVDAKFIVVGFIEPDFEMQKRIGLKQIEIFKLVDYLEQIKMMAKVDVNIAPLVVNEFTNCKSELKFFEAAVVETTTIASPTYTFSRAISDGENGFLAQPGKWLEKMEFLYDNSAVNQKVGKVARKYVIENYYGKKFLKEVERVYDSFR